VHEVHPDLLYSPSLDLRSNQSLMRSSRASVFLSVLWPASLPYFPSLLTLLCKWKRLPREETLITGAMSKPLGFELFSCTSGLSSWLWAFPRWSLRVPSFNRVLFLIYLTCWHVSKEMSMVLAQFSEAWLFFGLSLFAKHQPAHPHHIT
jgi:hypothetical protein